MASDLEESMLGIDMTCAQFRWLKKEESIVIAEQQKVNLEGNMTKPAIAEQVD